jgi:hypothetical protein
MHSFRVGLRTATASLSSINWLVLAQGTRCFVRLQLRAAAVPVYEVGNRRQECTVSTTLLPSPTRLRYLKHCKNVVGLYITDFMMGKIFFICQNKFPPNTELRVQTVELQTSWRLTAKYAPVIKYTTTDSFHNLSQSPLDAAQHLFEKPNGSPN